MVNMIKQTWLQIRQNYRLMIIAFELFWIGIFLLHRAAGSSASELPGFVYVNF